MTLPMLDKETVPYLKLSDDQAAYLWSRLVERQMVEGDSPASRDDLVKEVRGYTHSEVILTLVDDPKVIAMDIAGVLLERPIYQCARGETGEALTDIHGNPVRFPLGHRRGELPNPIDRLKVTVKPKTRTSDPRIVTQVGPNTKKRGSAAYNRYNMYREGMTVEWHLKNTEITQTDIKYDTRAGSITLERKIS